MAAKPRRTTHPVITRVRELHDQLYSLDPLAGLSPSPLARHSKAIQDVGADLTAANDFWANALVEFEEVAGKVAAVARTITEESDPERLTELYADLEQAGRQAEAHGEIAHRAAAAARAAAYRYRAATATTAKTDEAARQGYVSDVVAELAPMVQRYREAATALADATADIRGLLSTAVAILHQSDPALASRVGKAVEALPGRLALAEVARGGDAVAPMLIESLASGESQYLAAYHSVIPTDADEQRRIGAVSAAGFGGE